MADTQVLVWMLSGDPRLSSDARALLERRDVTRFLSAASVWEATIKRTKGKITFPDEMWRELQRGGFAPLHITVAHAEAAGSLPLHHTDPFDRMLVAQAQLEGLSIMTSDPVIGRYAVHVLAA